MQYAFILKEFDQNMNMVTKQSFQTWTKYMIIFPLDFAENCQFTDKKCIIKLNSR